MATFDLGKDPEDVIEPELMSDGWYPFEIYKEPTLEKNKVMKTEGPEADKAGYNVVVDVRCIEDSEHRGRVFRTYLSLPGVGDDERRNPVTGEYVIDQKVNRNSEFALAFGGTVEGSSFSISKGMCGLLPVVKQMDRSGVKFINQINPFNEPCAKPMPDLSGMDLGTDAGEDDIPF